MRLYSGERGGIHVGVAHAELSPSDYVRQMRQCKAWLSTTGPADLVGTRFFEVMATGTTIVIANRLSESAAYSSLGIVEGRHALMFASLDEFEETVLNLTRVDFEPRRRAIVARAQELAFRRFSWAHIAARVEAVLRCGAHGCNTTAQERHRFHTPHEHGRARYPQAA